MKIGKPKRIIEVEPRETDAPSPATAPEPERRSVPDEDGSRREKEPVPQKKQFDG